MKNGTDSTDGKEAAFGAWAKEVPGSNLSQGEIFNGKKVHGLIFIDTYHIYTAYMLNAIHA